MDVNEHTIRYEIQVWRDCLNCPDHPAPGWYPSKHFRGILADPNTSQDYARTLLERLRDQSFNSRFRLVEIETVHRVTTTVVD